MMLRKNDFYEDQITEKSRCCCFRCSLTVGFAPQTTTSRFIGRISPQFTDLATFCIGTTVEVLSTLGTMPLLNELLIMLAIMFPIIEEQSLLY
jgi:hypothetical protein